jgi:hypothetical protein
MAAPVEVGAFFQKLGDGLALAPVDELARERHIKVINTEAI